MSARRVATLGPIVELKRVRPAGGDTWARGVYKIRTGRYRMTIKGHGAPVLTLDTRTGEHHWQGTPPAIANRQETNA